MLQSGMLQTPICTLFVVIRSSVRRERDCSQDGNPTRVGLAYALALPLWIPAFAGMTAVAHKTHGGGMTAAAHKTHRGGMTAVAHETHRGGLTVVVHRTRMGGMTVVSRRSPRSEWGVCQSSHTKKLLP